MQATQQKWVASVMSDEPNPRPLEDVSGVLTTAALVVAAATRHEAKQKMIAWMRLNEAHSALAAIHQRDRADGVVVGHDNCSETCDCPQWVRDAKRAIREQQSALEAE